METSESESVPVDAPRPTWGERLQTPAGRLALRVLGVIVVLTVLLLIFGLWWPIASLPTTASDTEQAVRLTMIVFSLSAAPVMAVVWGICYYSLRHWRHKGEEPPEDGPAIRGSNKVVGSWLIISAVLTAFLLIWGLAAFTAMTSTATAASPMVVKVTGQQWVWSFSYPQDGGVSSNELMLPVNRPVVFQVTSTDVIHSFWIPEMGIKVDANPEVTTETSTTPDLVGAFNVRCAELCGLNHSYMQTTVNVMSQDDFDSWVRSHGGVPGQAVSAEASNG